jgi:hypothetical protein
MRPRLIGLAVLVLAIALGMALGAGPLQHDASQRSRAADAQAARLAATGRQVAQLAALSRAAAAYDDATASSAVRGTLTGRGVALVALPGADPATLTALRTLLATAGAQVTADVLLGAQSVTGSSRQLVEALTSQMVAQAQLSAPTSDDGYQRFGLLLARAIGIPSSTHTATTAYDATALAIMAGFQTAGLVSSAKVSSRAALVLVVAGTPARPGAASAQNSIPVSILRAMAAAVGTVVAGPGRAALPWGVVGSLRSGSPGMSTTDSSELTRGRVAAVLALAALTRGVIGNYGAVGQVDGPIPRS